MSEIITGVKGTQVSASLGGVPVSTTTLVDQYAGYFRIGDVVLTIPPEQIQCHKVINNEEVMPIRFPFGLPVKTGQSRWDVTWSWKALADFDTQDYTQWLIVQRLLAMFKAAPFVEVENEHIRQIVNPSTLTTGATADDVMAFALRQMRVDTVPDLIDTLQVTMTMSLFNWRPYSKNFQYDAGGGVPAASAAASPAFTAYLNTWIQNNIDSDPTSQPLTGPAVSTAEWQSEEPGTVTLYCREYVGCAVPYTPASPTGTVNPPPANPGATTPGTATQGNTNGLVSNVVISPINSSNPQIGWWITAVEAGESGGSYTAVNLTTKTNSGAPSACAGLLQWTRSSAIEAMQASDKYCNTNYVSIAQQNGYLIATHASPGYTWNPNQVVPNPLSVSAPIATYIAWMQNPPSSVTGGGQQLQNNMAIGWAILKLNANSGNVLSSWEAQLFGQGKVNNNTANIASQNNYFNTLANSWRSSSGNPQAFLPTTNSTPAPQPVPPAPSTTVTSGTNTNPTISPTNASSNPTSTPPITYHIQYYLNEGWTYDYWTNFAAFLYKVHSIKMTSLDPVFGTNPSSSDLSNIDPQHFVYPNQISVVFANNIAQLPMASYQYPTYQHLGPVSTLVSIGMLSNANIPADTDTYPEPEHTGLSLISDMTSLLEEQFQRLRTEWRLVASIQSMQAMSVQNQVLNLLGIRGLLTKELTTETIPDSPNLVNAQYNAIQYENVFEEVYQTDPFFADTVPATFAQTWETILRDGTLNAYANNSALSELTLLSSQMQNPTSVASQLLLYKWLVGTPQPPPSSYTIALPQGFTFTGAQQNQMIKILDENAFTLSSLVSSVVTFASSANKTFTTTYPDISAVIKSHALLGLNYSDYFIIKNWIANDTGANVPDASTFLNTIVPAIESGIQAALNALNPVPESPLNTLFDAYFANAYSNQLGNLPTQMNYAMTIPAIQARFVTPTTVVTPGGPGQNGAPGPNESHGCYRDLGIPQFQLGGRDYTPAVYFHDDNKDINTDIQSQISQITNTVIQSAQNFYNATPILDRSALLQSLTSITPTTVQSILSRVGTTSYTMAKAFPTFKLFLMEDDSLRPFYAFDKFYSYATVLDMEIIRYRDKPDTAVIQISNLMHLLDQHLYDTTPQGRQLQRVNYPVEIQLPSGIGALTSEGGTGGQTVNVDAVNIDNRFPQLGTAPGDQKFPLAYFALQTGTKIQIRMGFSNIPDNLTPVFTGQITDIQGDEILTITAQSYMLELIAPTNDPLLSPGFSLDGTLNSMVNNLAYAVRDIQTPSNLWTVATTPVGTTFSHSPSYSGVSTVGGTPIYGLTSPGGTVMDVMAAMLHVSSAKHFGFWQWGATPDTYIKGWSFNAALGSALAAVSSSPTTQLATGIESGYDRCYENILTSHVFGPNGTVTTDLNGSSRGWLYEKPAGFGAPEYFVPKDPNLTPWTLIQDIARRFPEFILAVKQYGFPYTADATLVFGHPNDFYTSRALVPSDIELQQQATQDDQTFNKWWTIGTSSGQAQLIAFCETVGSQWVIPTLTQYENSINHRSPVSSYNPFFSYNPFALFTSPGQQLSTYTNKLVSYVTNATTFFTIVGLLDATIGSKASAILDFGGANAPGQGVSRVAAQQALAQIVQNYYTYFQQSSANGANTYAGSRMQPIRRFHLVNADSIVHNGILLNDKFYNSVSLDNNILYASDALAPGYIRMLYADSAVVSLENVHNWPQGRSAYIQTFLRDEVSKMYRGELVLLGNPEIEPFDVVTLSDPSMGITGPIEVDSVIHSFNQENGYITIIKPRAVVVINDALSMSTYAATQQMLAQVGNIILGYANQITGIPVNATNLYGQPILSSVGSVSLDTAAVVGGLVAGPWISAAVAIAATTFLFWAGQQVQDMNPIGIVPLSRFERPWIGGLEGFRIANLYQQVGIQWQYFLENEIYPSLYSFRQAKQMGLIPKVLGG